MEMLAQFGYGQLDPWACSLYGLILLSVSIFLALNMERPEK